MKITFHLAFYYNYTHMVDASPFDADKKNHFAFEINCHFFFWNDTLIVAHFHKMAFIAIKR